MDPSVGSITRVENPGQKRFRYRLCLLTLVLLKGFSLLGRYRNGYVLPEGEHNGQARARFYEERGYRVSCCS